MVAVAEAGATSDVLTGRFGDDVTEAQSVAVHESEAVRNASYVSAELRKAQAGNRQPTPEEVEAIFRKAGISVDLVNAADPQAAYDAAVKALVASAGSDLNTILGKNLAPQEIEALIDDLSK